MKLNKEIKIRNKKLSDADILKALKKLGKLDKKFKDQDLLLDLVNSKNKNIRYYSINNLAKLNNEKLLKNFESFLYKEPTSYVRREIASAIGRLRSKKAIPVMKKILKDNDPNVILQGVRGLLVFKKDKNIEKTVAKLINQNKTIGWFQSRGEYGKRSLGCRSILADPRKLESKSRINQLLKKRDWFMPYAPSILEEYVDDFAEKPGKSLYMQINSSSIKF